ncbi:MAG: YdcF family protein [Clostridia bacterium]|nr:YdcF family protein [Clostridia bacterium]
MKLSEINVEALLSKTWEEKWDFVCRDMKDGGETAEVALLLGTFPKEAISRAKTAARLYRDGRVQYIVPSGGVEWELGGERLREAELMKRVLLSEGVPEEAILPDYEARTTVENMICGALTIARGIKLKNVSRVLLVTSLFHMQRSLALARALLPRKFTVFACPDPQDRDEWLREEENRIRLDKSIVLLKNLVANGVVEDVEVSI